MNDSQNKTTAQSMISVYGLRAQAVVTERIAESRARGDAGDFRRWESVDAAIMELRRSAPARPR